MSRFKMKLFRACHKHDNNFYEVIKIKAFGTKYEEIELCEYFIICIK